MKNKKTVWKKDDPLVQELLRRVRIKFMGSEDVLMGDEDLFELCEEIIRVTNGHLNIRTLKEYLGYYPIRVINCSGSLLNAFAFYIGAGNFYSFKKEKENKLRKKLLRSNLKQSDVSSGISGTAAMRTVEKNLINSVELRDEIYKILINIYDDLETNSNVEDIIDFYGFNSSGEKFDFACTILNYNNKPFDSVHLAECKSIINEIRQSEQQISKYIIICNTLTNTDEFKIVVEEFEKLLIDKVVGEAGFYDIKSFIINEVVNVLAFDLKFLLISSNKYFRDQFNKQLNQDFYLENIPFSTNQIQDIKNNPVNYLMEILTDDKQEKIQKGKIKKHWNFILSEFGFGKTSLLLKITSLINQKELEFLFLPISLFGKHAFDSAMDISRNVLKIIYEGKEFDYSDNYNMLMSGVFKNMIMNNPNLIILFDGLDEHHFAYDANSLERIFNSTSKLNSECIFSMRKEFWDDRQGSFESALRRLNKPNFLFLTEWANNEIINFIHEVLNNEEITIDEKERISEFKELVIHDKYEEYYGDIPKRPLFLKMLIIDIKNNRIKKRNLSEIYEQYLLEKFNYDRVSQFSTNTRTPLRLEHIEDRFKVLGKIFSILEKAASLMFVISDKNECILVSSVNENKLEEEIQLLKEKELSVTEVMLNSILVPFGKRDYDGFYLKFAHKSFQEYFFARAIYYTLIKPNHYDNLNHILKSKHSDGVVTFIKGIIESKRERKAEFFNCILSLSKIKIEDISSTSLIGILLDYFSDDILSVSSE